MKYVGIDLGTTNSAICSYDGESIRLYKSPEQHDVTPSAIFIDKRGNKYVGSRAYNNAARNPDNAATLFKRLMGTSTPMKLLAVNLTMTPEECSAEILRVLFGYLPEEIRNDGSAGTVITVPAAFNQMQKDSTMAAADAAGIGRVALMQEPVAAAMSVMRQRKNDGLFVVYDLGGGTLDVAIAESISSRVSLLAHGGIAMCGGRDFDRMLFDSVVKPWLLDNFKLPEDLSANPRFKSLLRMATWAAEKAKIELSQKEEAVVSLPETELGVRDLSDQEIYLDIAIDRKRFDDLISSKIEESIQAARDTLEKAGLSPHDVERVVFVGGPTHYKPLRDKVAFELGIAPSTDVNPMTAVAEGAAVFAESIDWASQSRGRKSARGAISARGALDLSFNYIARTPDSKAKIVAKLGGQVVPGAEFQMVVRTCR
ncbi:MAG: Hsp70 family protein, partial [Pyrinomonadaceae bacterium]